MNKFLIEYRYSNKELPFPELVVQTARKLKEITKYDVVEPQLIDILYHCLRYFPLYKLTIREGKQKDGIHNVVYQLTARWDISVYTFIKEIMLLAWNLIENYYNVIKLFPKEQESQRLLSELSDLLSVWIMEVFVYPQY